MNVPNQYKGFSRLPEDVQRRMDPELAQQYQMGGAVMQRPLFRNMGGPAQPMPQDMAPAAPGPDPMMAEQLMQAEQGASDQAMMMGQEYMANMESRLDAAETPEDVINAIRGNDLPMEARYQELAGLVGEDDAMQTPESVLAMVQPTIMMTEQGALDSGIGELVRNIAGGVEMEGPGGESTAMGGGVGSLMMAGAGNTPPQNFSQGGAVRLAKGGDPVQKYYEQRLPLYESIIGGGDEAKAASQAQALFAIADAAGRFASGIGAQGQDVRGLSPAAQLAAATTGLGGQLGAIGAQADQADRSARLAALQAAESEYAADRAAARAKTTSALGEIFEVVDKETGEVLATVPIGTTADYAAVAEQYPNSLIREPQKPKAPSMQTMVNIEDPTQILPVDTSNPEAYSAAIESGFVPLADRKTIQELQNPSADPIVLYSAEGMVMFDLSMPEQRERYNELVNNSDYTTSPLLYQTQLEAKVRKEQFVFEQDRRVADKIEEELRAQEYKIDEEDREVLRQIAKEEREQDYTISGEKRRELLEIAREERAVAIQIEAELRAQDYAIAAEDRELVRQIAKEERQLGRTLKAEDRAARLEELREQRKEEQAIAQELRQQGYIKASEDREVLRAIAAEERAIDRDLKKEERAALAEQLRFDRDQAAKIEAELRAQGYTIEAEDRAFARAIAAEERALKKTLDKEERKKRYDAFIFERDQSTAPVKGIPRELFNQLDEETQNRIIAGDPKDPQAVKGIPRDIYDALTAEEQEAVLELGEEEPSTLLERQQEALLNTDTVTKFASGELGDAETAELMTVLQSYIAPSQGPQGTTTSKPIPINIQQALKQRQELGLDTFGIDPALFGEAISPSEFNNLTQSLIDPNVDLEKGAGLLSGLAGFINYVGEQTIGETGIGSGVLFKGTKEAQQALAALNAATRKFSLEGRQLAQELGLQLEELPKDSFTKSDAKTLSNIETQQDQLGMFIERVQEALKNPAQFTSSDLSKTRLQLKFAIQLKKAYDAAYDNLAPFAGGKTKNGKPNASDFRRD